MVDVTVIIPVHNRTGLAKEAIASALAAAPTLRVQIAVVDDGSHPDESVALEQYCAAIPECEYFREPENVGVQLARNHGLERACGRYIKFLDSDDVLVRDALDDEFRCIEEAQVDILISGWTRKPLHGFAGEITRGECGPYPGNPYDAILAGFGAPIAAILYKRTAIGTVRWNNGVRHPDDWFFLIKVLLANPSVATRSMPVFEWRDHDGPRVSSVTQVETARSRFQILSFVHAVMCQRGCTTTDRRIALAHYLYRDTYIAHRFDSALFSQVTRLIDSLVAKYQPSQRVEPSLFKRSMIRAFGYKRYVSVHNRLQVLLLVVRKYARA